MQKRQNLPIVCGTLVVINVIVYLICTFTGDLLYNIGELDAVQILSPLLISECKFRSKMPR